MADWDADWSGIEDDVWPLFKPVSLPAEHPAARYLGGGQNDASILRLQVGRSQARLELGHYDVSRLASLLSEHRIPWHDWSRAFPVTLWFDEVSEVQIVRAVEQEVFQKIRYSGADLGKRLQDVAQIHCLLFHPERQRYLLKLNGRHPYRRSPKVFANPYSNEFWVAIECRSLRVDERYREGWRRIFGGQYEEVLDAWESVWPVPRWGMPDFEEWLAKHFPTVSVR